MKAVVETFNVFSGFGGGSVRLRHNLQDHIPIAWHSLRKYVQKPSM